VRPSGRAAVRRIIAQAFPCDETLEIAALRGGQSNASFRVGLARNGDVVVRMYRRDPAAMRKEIALLERLTGDVPVPALLSSGDDERAGPFVIYRYVPGVTLRELKQTGDRVVLAQAAFATGYALATLGRHARVAGTPFRAGDPALASATTLPGFLQACAADDVFGRSAGPRAAERLREAVALWHGQLLGLLAEPVLIHGDFSRSNVIVRCDERPLVAAIIDWEFACGGSPLFDIGHFLRYERTGDAQLEPHFHEGFLAGGGVLPAKWRTLARLADLAGLAGALTKRALPGAARKELRKLLERDVRLVVADAP